MIDNNYMMGDNLPSFSNPLSLVRCSDLAHKEYKQLLFWNFPFPHVWLAHISVTPTMLNGLLQVVQIYPTRRVHWACLITA